MTDVNGNHLKRFRNIIHLFAVPRYAFAFNKCSGFQAKWNQVKHIWDRRLISCSPTVKDFYSGSGVVI